MNRRKLSRITAAGLLAALLALPAQAAVPHGRVPGNAWEWLTSLWQSRIAALWPGSEAAQKEGHGIDPNGGSQPVPTGPGPSISPNGGTIDTNDQGHGIDPNG